MANATGPPFAPVLAVPGTRRPRERLGGERGVEAAALKRLPSVSSTRGGRSQRGGQAGREVPGLGMAGAAPSHGHDPGTNGPQGTPVLSGRFAWEQRGWVREGELPCSLRDPSEARSGCSASRSEPGGRGRGKKPQDCAQTCRKRGHTAGLPRPAGGERPRGSPTETATPGPSGSGGAGRSGAAPLGPRGGAEAVSAGSRGCVTSDKPPRARLKARGARDICGR